ncbi:MAG TPA: hypothetical protein VK974_08535 [Methylophilaceae bacterium]|nr:hypothetical protein [Methylophilaceae bacterium]
MLNLAVNIRNTALALTFVTLSGCVGGPIAQQIASSIISQTADNYTSNKYDEYLLNKAKERPNIVLKDTEPDRYWAAFVTSGFAETPVTTVVDDASKKPDSSMLEKSEHTESSRLVCVEVWNLLIGQEKISVLEKAQLLGSTQLPKPEEWANWQVATGALETDRKRTITFLIPPDFGKFFSGERAFVEISDVGGLHIARHLAN